MAGKRKSQASQRPRKPSGTFLAARLTPLPRSEVTTSAPLSFVGTPSPPPASAAFSLEFSPPSASSSRSPSPAPTVPVLRSSCLRCFAANAARALGGEVEETGCRKARASHTRCTLCAGKNKRCVRPGSDRRSAALSLALQQGCDRLFALSAADRPLPADDTTAVQDALAGLQAYVFRDGDAVVPGGVGGTPARVRVDNLAGVVAELRLLREEMAGGFAAVVAALHERV